LQPSFRW
jgi:Predicted permease